MISGYVVLGLSSKCKIKSRINIFAHDIDSHFPLTITITINNTRMASYNPSASGTTPTKLAEFIRKPLNGDLSVDKIPGLGEAGISRLRAEGVLTTFALVGKFLSLHEGDGSVPHCNRFFQWLKDSGISTHRAEIVQAVAQKCNIPFDGIYDESDF